MCMMCEGFSHQDMVAIDVARIAEYGYTVIGVDGSADGSTSWSYTVGLLDTLDHPELVVVGPAIESGATLLNAVARRLLRGRRLRPGDEVKFGPERVRVGAVHDVQYELDTFNVWHDLHEAGELRATRLEAVQVFTPSSWRCPDHQDAQPVLADPLARID